MGVGRNEGKEEKLVIVGLLSIILWACGENERISEEWDALIIPVFQKE